MKNYFVFATQKFGKEISARDLTQRLQANPDFKITVSSVKVFSCHNYPEKCFLAEIDAIKDDAPQKLISSFNATLKTTVRFGNAHCLSHGHLGAYRAIFNGVEAFGELQVAINALIHTAPFLLTVVVEEKPVEGTKVYVGYVFYDCIDRAQKLKYYLQKYVHFGKFEPIEGIVSFN